MPSPVSECLVGEREGTEYIVCRGGGCQNNFNLKRKKEVQTFKKRGVGVNSFNHQ